MKFLFKVIPVLFLLMVLGFWFRFDGLSSNYSFWIDEASSATFGRAILDRGIPVLPTGYAANDYTIHFYLMAASFKLFGLTEFAARFPSVIFGVLTILVVYFLGKQFADKKVGLVAAFLTTFSVLEIVYSRQARSYQEVQFFFLLTVLALFVLFSSYDKKRLKIKHLLFLFIAFALSALTHKFALLFLFEAAIFIFLFRFDFVKNYLVILVNFIKRNKLFGWLMAIVLTSFFLFSLRYFNFYKAINETTLSFWSGKFGFNTRQYLDIVFTHLKYYHSFLWRQYPHITTLALMGLILGVVKKNRLVYFFLAAFFVHFGFVMWRVLPQFVRYVYLVFPFFLILASYFLVWISESLLPKKRFVGNLLLVFLAVFLVVNGNKFSFIPKSYYSLNLDMVELPEPDFKSIYQIIKNKVDLNKEKVVIVDNRTDAAEWYLGEGNPTYYLIGPNELEPTYNLKHDIKKDPVSGALYLNDLDEFKKIVNQNKKGFVVFETRALEYVNVDPQIINYVKSNLKREVRIENIVGNDLSIWPMELYSWGD